MLLHFDSPVLKSCIVDWCSHIRFFFLLLHNTRSNICDQRFAPVQPLPPNSIKPNGSRLSPYPNPYQKINIPRTGISYSSTIVSYERYPSHIRAHADHHRRRPSTQSPLPPCNLATAAARQSDMGIAKSCGCPAGLSRQSGGCHKTVRRNRRRHKTVWHGNHKTIHRLSSEIGGLRKTAAAGSRGLFGHTAHAAANLANTNLQGTVKVMPHGRPTVA
jgi:hypothetical protein